MILLCLSSFKSSFATTTDYGGLYQLSNKCLKCLDQDFVQMQKTYAQMSGECIKQESEDIRTRFLITLNLVTRSIEIFAKYQTANQEAQIRLQKRASYLKKSSKNFLEFVDKFCSENFHYFSGRACGWIYYYEMTDLINTRLHHLENGNINFLCDISEQYLINLFKEIVGDILKESIGQIELTYEQIQKIEIFLKLSKLLNRLERKRKVLDDMLDHLKNIYTKDNKSKALAIYNKIKSYFSNLN